MFVLIVGGLFALYLVATVLDLIVGEPDAMPYFMMTLVIVLATALVHPVKHRLKELLSVFCHNLWDRERENQSPAVI